MQETLTLRLKVNGAPVEVRDAARAYLGTSRKTSERGSVHLMEFPVGILCLLNKCMDFFFSRIRMEQLMSITQEETENLRRREIACESQCGEGNRAWLTQQGVGHTALSV